MAMKYKQLYEGAEERCQKLHGRNLIDVYTDEDMTYDALQDIYDSLGRRLALKDMNNKVINERVIEKPFIPSKSIKDPYLNLNNKDNKIFIDYWRDKWNTGIVEQPLACDMYCLGLVSQAFKKITIYRDDKKEDIRLHICLIMPSGTGKSEGNNIICEVADMVGLTHFSVDRFTDAILTGSRDQKVVDRNVRMKLDPGMENWEDPVRQSVLVTNDIIVYDEGENILKTNQATEGAQRILQKAMNRYGSAGNTITNALVSDTIISNPDCSIFITSYYLKEFKETLLERGLLQRMWLLIEEESDEKRDRIMDKIIDAIPSYENDISEAYAHQAEMEARNKKINDNIIMEMARLREFHKDTTSIVIHKDTIKLIKESIITMKDTMPILTYQHDIWNSMISRLMVNALKISALFSIMNYRTSIEEYDARAAINLITQTMDTVAFFLKKNIKKEVSRKVMTYHNALKNIASCVGFSFTLEKWTEIIADEMHVPTEIAVQIFKLLVEYDKIKPIPATVKKEKPMFKLNK